jgi:hypothetical protein
MKAGRSRGSELRSNPHQFIEEMRPKFERYFVQILIMLDVVKKPFDGIYQQHPRVPDLHPP